MSSPIGSKRNVKIFVLYLMENIDYPLDFPTLNDIVMQTDYVMYLDFAEAFQEMLDMGLILETYDESEKANLYCVSEKGRCVAQELHSDILSTILDKSLQSALRYLDFKKRGIEAHCTSRPRADGRYDVSFSFPEKKPGPNAKRELIFSATLAVDTSNRAERMIENFKDHPESMYRGIVALFAGDVNYLFT